MYRKIPSRELTYPPKNGILKMIFLFPPEGHHVYNVLEICTHVIPCHTDCVICSRILPAIPQASPHLQESTRITCNIHNSQCIYHINIMCLNMYTIQEHT